MGAGQAIDGGGVRMAQWKMARDSPSPRPPGRPRDSALDEAILAATVRHLGERGYEGMSIGGIAAAAGTTAPSLRRRYRNKLKLAVAAIDFMHIEPPPDAEAEPRAAALAVLENLRTSMLSQKSMAILGTILAEELRNPELLDRFRQRLIAPRRERLRRALARGVETGHLQATLDLDAAVSLLIGALTASYLHTGRIPEAWAETTLSIIWPARPLHA
jgi:AcrR family transcriptional regulator